MSGLCLLAGALGVGAGLGSNPAGAQSRTWAASGTYEEIVIADCRDCGDDIGMMVACRGARQPAEVTVHWASTENGREGAIVPIIFNIDGATFTRQATTVYYGQIGYTPEFALPANDPMIAALQSGSTARISFADARVEIPLNGSRSAFEIFKAHCGWNDVATAAEPDDGATWFATRYDDDKSGRQVRTLTFGIPETDAVALNATCETDEDGAFVTAMLLVDFGDQQDGAAVDVEFRSTGFEKTFAGLVFAQSSEYAGVQMQIDIDDPVWGVLQGGQPVSFGVRGLNPVTMSTSGATATIGSFQAGCRATGAN
jgi:hypothetical protein